MTSQAILTVIFSAAAAALASFAVVQTVRTTPLGAIVAFEAPGECPDGWTDYAAADGRVLLGSGEAFRHGTMGGQEAVSWEDLGVQALPVAHTSQYVGGPGVIVPQGGGASISYVALGRLQSSDRPAAGSRQTFASIPTMPPFIALRFCAKA